ncbi:hypothetical protein BJ138DRAFT_1091910 [Hygrophoropsis aurantiaca]|uniref:Uncharacterized protein n=1 Tax=Hygrophoropsis aurantiaca TaxID=72124 RepID=A0ACB8A5T1_9AGAM|nr:hypothetical protein BJ138DRAFT_1091910 [Hygrophoropsis aurantiaca]
MDLNPIGKHCALSSCNELDFLPIRCRCDRVFCRFHALPDNHDCTIAAKFVDNQHTFEEKLQRCAFQDCNKPSLHSIVRDKASNEQQTSASYESCPGCRFSFCADHRYPESHSCSGAQAFEVDAKSKNATARSLLARHFGTPLHSSLPVARKAAKPSTDPKKIAQLQKVTLMKMRHHAQPGDPKDRTSSVAIDQRLHVAVTTDTKGKTGEERIFWFRKPIGTGKALDLLADQFGISDSNCNSLRLVRLSVDGQDHIPLHNDRPLMDQVEDTSSLVLTALPSVS